MTLLADSMRSLSAGLLVVALIILALVVGQSVLMPLAVGILFAFALSPVVQRLVVWHLPQRVAVTVVLGFFVIILGAASTLLSGELLVLTGEFSEYSDNLAKKVKLFTEIGRGGGVVGKAIQSVGKIGTDIAKQVSDAPPAPPPTVESTQSERNGEAAKSTVQGAPQTSAVSPTNMFLQVWSLIPTMTMLALTFLFTLFVLLQNHDLRDRVIRIVGTENLSETTAAMEEAGTRLSNLFFAQTLINFGFGIYVGLGCIAIGIPSAPLWGVVAMALRFLPFIGAYLAAIPPTLLAAGVDPGWTMALETIVLFVTGELVLGNVVEPHLLGRHAGLSPFAMILSASFWTLIWGPIGLVLSTPITMALVVLGQHVPRLQFLSVLLGDAPALSPAEQFYHVLLTGDPLTATELLGVESARSSPIAASDALVLPALRQMASDFKRGRLDDAQIVKVEETMEEVIVAIRDLSSETMVANGMAGGQPGATVFVTPVSGRIDILATHFLCSVLQASGGIVCREASALSGLLALREGAKDGNGKSVATVVIATVGSVERQHLSFLVKRAKASFPAASLIICDIAGDGDVRLASGASLDTDLGSRCTSLGKLRDLLGEVAPRIERPAQAEAKRLAQSG